MKKIHRAPAGLKWRGLGEKGCVWAGGADHQHEPGTSVGSGGGDGFYQQPC